MGFKKDACLGIAAIELDIPDFDLKIDFNPNDQEESSIDLFLKKENSFLIFAKKVDEHLLSHPEEKDHVAENLKFLDIFLGALSDQLNKKIGSSSSSFFQFFKDF